MSAAPFLPLYTGDYMRDAGHLNVLEHGAYLLLLMAAWNDGGRLPNDDAKLMRLARCNKRQWETVKGAIIGFFDETPEGLIQRRLRREITKYENEIEKRRYAGKIGGEAKARKTQEAELASAKQMLESATSKTVAKASQPEPEPKEEDKSSSISEPSVPRQIVKMRCEEFDEVWRLWPQKGRSAKSKALALWKAKGMNSDPAMMLAAVRRYLAGPDAKKDAGAYVPALERWIRDRLESWLEVGVALNTPTSMDFRLKIFADTQIWDEAWGPRPELIEALPLLEASR
jgi:uncharacterized protein YdaU (DUF1376 family)